MPAFMPLAPSNLARSPVLWSALEVKAWLRFCIQSFDLTKIRAERFDLNGKALMLLTRLDFMERAPQSGDVLFNALQQLQKRQSLEEQISGSNFVPILPKPPESSGSGDQSYRMLKTPEKKHKSNTEGQGRNCSDSPEIDFVRAKDDRVDCRLLWMFIYRLLLDTKWSQIVFWESADELIFRIYNPERLARAWGKQKNRSNMTYEKLSRSLRNYYKAKIIRKVTGKQLTYQYLQHPLEIKKGKSGVKPRSSRVLTEVKKACTPDFSTCLPTPSTYFLDTPSKQLLNKSRSTVSSPGKHPDVVESWGNAPSVCLDIHEVSHVPNVSSPVGSESASFQREQVLPSETTNLTFLYPEVHADRLLTKSSRNDSIHTSYRGLVGKYSPAQGVITCINHVSSEDNSLADSHDSDHIPQQTVFENIGHTTDPDDNLDNCFNQCDKCSDHNLTSSNRGEVQYFSPSNTCRINDQYFTTPNTCRDTDQYFTTTIQSKYVDQSYLSQPSINNHISQHKQVEEFPRHMSMLHQNAFPLPPTVKQANSYQHFGRHSPVLQHKGEKLQTQMLDNYSESRATHYYQSYLPRVCDLTIPSKNYWDQERHSSSRSIDYYRQSQYHPPSSYKYGPYAIDYCDQKSQPIHKPYYESLPNEYESYDQGQCVPEDLSVRSCSDKMVY